VADEVRKLAERTGSATLEIASMIQAIQQEMHAASQGMHTALGRISSGVAHSEDTAESIAGIHDTMSNMVTRIRDIARATEEQSTASQDISSHIEHINQMSQHTDQQISEASAETRRLRQLGQQLDALVQRFRT
jgi:methyl-accepting chemotaxis protein